MELPLVLIIEKFAVRTKILQKRKKNVFKKIIKPNSNINIPCQIVYYSLDSFLARTAEGHTSSK
jgi:hypothetical protein